MHALVEYSDEEPNERLMLKTHETLFADVQNLSIENATKMSKDRKLWSSNKPSLRCQPLSGGVAIK